MAACRKYVKHAIKIYLFVRNSYLLLNSSFPSKLTDKLINMRTITREHAKNVNH